MPPPALLSDAQLRAEIARCEACEEKPCREACPARCSAADFILAARVGDLPDVRRAAAEILLQNPLGGVCGFVCPDALCMAACARRGLDAPIRIPAVQAALVERARRAGGGPHGNLPAPIAAPSTGRRVAVVGAGPAGLAAAAMLALRGHTVVVFDEQDVPGGTLHRIPDRRLPRAVLRSDVAWALSL